MCGNEVSKCVVQVLSKGWTLWTVKAKTVSRLALTPGTYAWHLRLGLTPGTYAWDPRLAHAPGKRPRTQKVPRSGLLVWITLQVPGQSCFSPPMDIADPVD